MDLAVPILIHANVSMQSAHANDIKFFSRCCTQLFVCPPKINQQIAVAYDVVICSRAKDQIPFASHMLIIRRNSKGQHAGEVSGVVGEHLKPFFRKHVSVDASGWIWGQSRS